MSVYPKDAEILKSATISEDGAYRYTLGRSWARPGERPRLLPFVMLNPSTADGAEDDNTIRRCVGLARALGYTGIHVMNLFAFRATKPLAMWRAMDEGIDIVGPGNDGNLAAIFEIAFHLERPVVAAWGAAPKARRRVAEVCALPHANRLHAFRLTANGSPQHPLYLPADSELTPWSTNA